MEFVRSQRASPEHDPNTRHVIYGLVGLQVAIRLTVSDIHFRMPT